MVVAAVGAAWTAGALAQKPAPAIDPAAIAALEKMGAHLRTLKAFEARSTTAVDDVIGGGQKVQYGGTIDMKVRRPDRLRMDIATDHAQRQLFYDGRTVTLYGQRVKYYASVAAPATLVE